MRMSLHAITCGGNELDSMLLIFTLSQIELRYPSCVVALCPLRPATRGGARARVPPVAERRRRPK